MKMTAAAAIGALILAASAVPALAGGYWDGGIVQSGPPGAPIGGPPRYSDPNCPCYCPSDRQDDRARGDDRSGWRDQRGWSASERDDAQTWGDGRGWSGRH